MRRLLAVGAAALISFFGPAYLKDHRARDFSYGLTRRKRSNRYRSKYEGSNVGRAGKLYPLKGVRP